MKQIYPITVAVLLAVTICCSAIGVRPVTKQSMARAATISQTPARDISILASGE